MNDRTARSKCECKAPRRFRLLVLRGRQALSLKKQDVGCESGGHDGSTPGRGRVKDNTCLYRFTNACVHHVLGKTHTLKISSPSFYTVAGFRI